MDATTISDHQDASPMAEAHRLLHAIESALNADISCLRAVSMYVMIVDLEPLLDSFPQLCYDAFAVLPQYADRPVERPL